jgi:hypothetical protein
MLATFARSPTRCPSAEQFSVVIVTMHLGAEGPGAQRTRNATERFLTRSTAAIQSVSPTPRSLVERRSSSDTDRMCCAPPNGERQLALYSLGIC